jgi:hypothetical protein
MTETHEPTQTYFPEEEWRTLRAEDVHGGKMVAGLMTSIFVIGVILYTFVFLWTRP